MQKVLNGEKEYRSIEEILSEFLPNSLRREEIGKITDPHSLGILLAKTELKDIKILLEKTSSIVNSD
jgi:hypothetical protein